MSAGWGRGAGGGGDLLETVAHRRAFLFQLGSAAALLFVSPVAKPRPDAFAALAAQGDRLRGRVFLPGETVPWPVPVRVGDDWTLTFSDRPPVALLRSLGIADDGQLRIASNNVLLERLDSAQLDYGNSDRQIVYTGGTTPSASPNRWRVRPALTTEQTSRGALFDRLLFEVGGPLQGFTSHGEQIRSPEYRVGVPYRLNWFRGEQRQQTLVDPSVDLVVSELPLGARTHGFLAGEVALYRNAIAGTQPVLMVARGGGAREANYDTASGVVTLSAAYLSRPDLRTALDELLGSAIYWSAALSPSGEARDLAIRFAAELARAGAGALRLFGGSTRPERLFAQGLAAMTLRPDAFRARFEQLEPAQQVQARRIKNTIADLVHRGLELNGRAELLDRFVPRQLRRL